LQIEDLENLLTGAIGNPKSTIGNPKSWAAARLQALLAALVRRRTAASTEWIATRLQMGHPGSVSRQVGIVKKNRKLLKKLNKLEK
jgi:hypothetical protein